MNPGLCPLFAACALAVAAAPAGAAPIEGCAKGSEDEGFFARLAQSYRSHLAWDGGDPNAPATGVVGGAEVPESNPPWPYSTWNIGASQAIGVENMYTSALMDALYCGVHGQELKDSRFSIYGWVEPGGNWSTSHTRFNYATGTGGNYPAAYSFEPNTVQVDQVAMYFERTPDEVQFDHFDWGARFSGIYGTDYKYTFSNGVFSNQYLNEERQYGFDPVMYYLDFWFPKIAQGENIRVGRYISIPDIEAQLAPNNLTYSHSLLYTVDPYTQQGIVSTTRLTKNWQIQTELSAGNDVAPWVKSERHLTPAACVIWTSDSGRDNLYPCMNGLNDGNWRWNNVQHAVITWYHKFDAKFHMDTEVWYMWQSHTPNVENPAGVAEIARAYPYVRDGAPNGAQCNPAVVYCYSYEWAAVNYLNYQLDARDILVWRTDFLNDARAQRTGFKTRYYEFTLSYTHWMGDVIELRPEVRYEHAQDADAYDNPTDTLGAGRNSQVTIAADAILHFERTAARSVEPTVAAQWKGYGMSESGQQSIDRRAWPRSRQWRIVIIAAIAIAAAVLAIWLGGRLFGGHETTAVAAPSPPGTFRPTAQQLKTLTIETVQTHGFVSQELTEGKIAVDGDRTTPVFSPYSGRVTRVIAGIGDAVKAGAPLATLEAAEFVQAQSDLKAAAAQLKLARINEARKHALYDAKGGSLQDWQSAQADLSAAETALNSVQNRLRILGKSAADVTALEREPGIDTVATLTAPIAGVVVDRQIGPGEYLQSGNGTPLFTIADTSSVWLLANVRETDAALVKLGQPVEVRVPAYPQRRFDARVTYVAALIDPVTHRLPVRAEIDNRDSALKPEMFASFRILTGDASESPAVPESAVVYEGDAAHVWLLEPDGLLRFQSVRTGRSEAGLIEVLDGLSLGQRVVTKGGLFIDQAAVPAAS